MDTVTVTVEAVAGTGKSFKGNGTWFKRGKNARFNDFTALRKGQEIIVTAQGEWVSDFTTTGVTNPVAGPTPQTMNKALSGTNDNRNEVMNRQSAVKSVLGSPVIALLVKDLSLNGEMSLDVVDNLIRKYHDYISTGKLGATTPNERAALEETLNA